MVGVPKVAPDYVQATPFASAMERRLFSFFSCVHCCSELQQLDHRVDARLRPETRTVQSASPLCPNIAVPQLGSRGKLALHVFWTTTQET